MQTAQCRGGQGRSFSRSLVAEEQTWIACRNRNWEFEGTGLKAENVTLLWYLLNSPWFCGMKSSFPWKRVEDRLLVRKVLLLLVGFCLVSQGSIFCVVHQKIRVLKHHPGLCRKWVCALLRKTEDVLQKSSVWMSTYSFSSRPSSWCGGAMKHTGLQIRGTKLGYI